MMHLGSKCFFSHFFSSILLNDSIGRIFLYHLISQTLGAKIQPNLWEMSGWWLHSDVNSHLLDPNSEERQYSTAFSVCRGNICALLLGLQHQGKREQRIMHCFSRPDSGFPSLRTDFQTCPSHISFLFSCKSLALLFSLWQIPWDPNLTCSQAHPMNKAS